MDVKAVPGQTRLPQRTTCLAVMSFSVVVVAVTWWLVLRPGSSSAQTAFVVWINDPPRLLGAVLAATNVLLRPVPLAVVASALFGWILFTARGSARWEVLRATVLGFVLVEAITQPIKLLADQARPTASIPGLDVHGYPKDPFGNAYPSAHTSVAVALVTALWPWLSVPQRVVGVTVAALVALNRLYIGAHWPVDVVGGAAIGVFAGCLCWMVARRWPIRRQQLLTRGEPAGDTAHRGE